MNNSTIESIPHLNGNRWEKTIIKAKQQVINALTKPRLDDYTKESMNSIPTGLYRGIIVLLAIVAIAAFWTSAGKQISATAMLLDPVVKTSEHLSQFWADVSVIGMLAIGELGTILFSAVCSVLAEDKFKVIVFRVASIGCAMFAVLANVTITMRYDEGSTVYAWFVTLAPPLIVIAVGLVIENLLLRSVKARSEAQRAYDIALRDYDYYRARPDLHPSFNQRWYSAIYDELCYYKPMKFAIEELVRENEQYKAVLVKREIDSHQYWAALEIEMTNRPTLPPTTGEGLTSSHKQLTD